MSEITEATGVPETVDALKRYMETHPGINQSRIAKAIGVSITMVSRFLAGKYEGDIKTMAEKLREFLRREAERERFAADSAAFARTSQAEDALSVISFCHVHRLMGVIHAPAGLGKTMSLRHYAAENSWVRIVTCRPGMNQKEVLEEIMEALELVPSGGRGKMIKRLQDELEGSETILILDEAQHLRLKEFETVRNLFDTTRVPVVFVGTDDIIDRMTGKRNILYDQLFSRVGIKRKLKAQIRRVDVQLLMQTSGVEDRRDLIDFLFEVAKRKGYYRSMMHCLNAARIMAEKMKEELTISHLQVALQFLWDGGTV